MGFMSVEGWECFVLGPKNKPNGFDGFWAPETRNPNLEIRNKSKNLNSNVLNGSCGKIEIRMSKFEFRIYSPVWSFEFVSNFDIRISDLSNVFLPRTLVQSPLSIAVPGFG